MKPLNSVWSGVEASFFANKSCPVCFFFAWPPLHTNTNIGLIDARGKHMRMGDTGSQERSWYGLKDRAHHTYLPSAPLLHIKLLPYLLPPESTELQYPANTERGRASADFPATVACWHQRWKRAALNLCVCRSPCHDSPFLVHLVKPAEAASQPASRCHEGIRACSHASLAPPGLLPHAAEALKETLPSARTRSGVRYVCGLSWRFIYMSLEWFLSCSIFLPPPSLSTSSLYLTCSQAYAIASQSFYKKHFILHSELPRVSIGDNNGAAFGAAPRHSCVAM